MIVDELLKPHQIEANFKTCPAISHPTKCATKNGKSCIWMNPKNLFQYQSPAIESTTYIPITIANAEQQKIMEKNGQIKLKKGPKIHPKHNHEPMTITIVKFSSHYLFI